MNKFSSIIITMYSNEYLKNKYVIEEINQKRESEVKKWKWLVLIGCFLLQMLPYCITLNLNNVFVGSDWNTWVQGHNIYIGIGFTLGSVVSACLGPVIARLFNKQINYRLVYSLGIITAIIGFMGPGLIAIITKTNHAIPSIGVVVPILWVSVILAQLGTMIFSGIGVNNLISRWWPANKRGFALGIAFAGGSFGMIWLKQLLSYLSNLFGNITPTVDVKYPIDGNQYVTYVIFGVSGLVLGLIIVMFFCKKPLPPAITNISQKSDNKLLKNNDVSPLETRKYPVYWILGVGYMFIQMGTIHVSLNGLIIANTTVVANNSLDYNEIMGIGGSIYGVACILGNVLSGFVNDKLKPSRSILFAGLIQALAIFCLMYSTVNSSFAYLYFVLAGISVYIYTTMPAYLSGRLYGTTYSNNHVAILTIFLSIGFAIINSISGLITGPTGFNENFEIRNPQTLFGITVAGNFLALELFSIISMVLGTIVASVCCAMIRQKTPQGLKDYNPTKFTYIVNLKYGLSIKFWSLVSYYTKRNIRDFKFYKKELSNRKKKDPYYQVNERFETSTMKYLKSCYDDLSNSEMLILSNIYFYSIVDKKWIEDHENKRLNFNVSIDHLLKKNLVRIKKDNENKIYYALDKQLNRELDNYNSELRKRYPKVDNEILSLRKKISKIKAKYRFKINKLQSQLLNVDTKLNHPKKNQSIINKTTNQINKYEKIRDKKLSNCKSVFQQYIIDYEYGEKIKRKARIKHNLIYQKEQLINAIRKKIDKLIFLETLYKFQEIKGHCLYLEFINNKVYIYKRMIVDKISKKISVKLNTMNININKCDTKLEQLKNKNIN